MLCVVTSKVLSPNMDRTAYTHCYTVCVLHSAHDQPLSAVKMDVLVYNAVHRIHTYSNLSSYFSYATVSAWLTVLTQGQLHHCCDIFTSSRRTRFSTA